MTEKFYSIDLQTIPLNESRKVWRLMVYYNRDYHNVIASVNYVDVKHDEYGFLETYELFSDSARQLSICNLSRFSKKRVAEIANKLGAVFSNCGLTDKEDLQQIVALIWRAV